MADTFAPLTQAERDALVLSDPAHRAAHRLSPMSRGISDQHLAEAFAAALARRNQEA